MTDRRLELIVGKGGVGKSAVAASLAVAQASAGKRTLVVELARPGGLHRCFGIDVRTAGPPAEPREIRPGLWLGWIDGETALGEYLALILPVRRLVSTVLDSRVYRYFVAAAPGLKELMTVGKIWFEHERKREDGSPYWDRIVVDAGASGHALQYLRMPATAAQTFRSGLVHRESQKVAGLLGDQARTAVHVVALPESMPLVEAAEIVEQLHADLRLPVGRLFVNRCREEAPDGAEEGVARLQQHDAFKHELASVVVAVGAGQLQWLRIQREGISTLESRLGRQVEKLPELITEEFGVSEIDRLAEQLRAGIGETV